MLARRKSECLVFSCFEVVEVAAQGGMGIVLKGHDASLGRFVAIKVLKPELASNTLARKRFLREAKMAAAVSHDQVITIHAVDHVENTPAAPQRPDLARPT